MAKKLDYDSSHIQSLGGLEGVRTNASMYLGSTDASGVFLAVRELLDNGLDEHLAGRNSAVRLHIDKDGSYWVLDKGTGIPQGIKELHVSVNGKNVVNKVQTMQAVFGELHTSGKYRTEAYKVAVGTHGIGSKGTNATAEFFEASTFYKGAWYSVSFKKGRLTSPVTKLKAAPKGPDGTKLTSGTCIHFKPDSSIFSAKSFPPSMATDWAEIMAYLNPGFAIIISSPKGKKTFFSKTGPTEYVSNRITKLKAERVSEKQFEYKSDLADVVVAFTNCDGCDIRGFTNGLANTEGGTHLSSVTSSMFAGLTQALVKMGKERLVQSTKKGEKKPLFTAADFKEGLLGLVNAKLHKAQFSGQNKAKLTDSRMGKEFAAELTKACVEFFTKNKTLALAMAERATKLNGLKFNFAKSKKLVASLSQLKRKGMPVKYVPPNKSTKVSEREIFIVEGDSAGGPAKQARYPYQGILPIRGKIKNVIAAKGDKGLESEDILHILGAMGFDPKSEDPYSKLQVSKIILLADPDPDGYHINSLLLGLNYKYLPEAFSRGMVYVAKTPEYYSIYKGKLYTADGALALRKKLDLAKVPASVETIHIKGWGEIDPVVMRILAMNPDTRTLIRIKPLKDSDKEFRDLMSESPESRRKLAGMSNEN